MPPATVLVIEDEEDVQHLLEALLARAGYDVRIASDGRAGLRALHEARPDLVLLDVGLPVLDGWHVLERIRDLSDVPVLMVTAHAEELERVRGLRAGADDYVAKPFGKQELLARVDALLRRTRGRVEVREAYVDARLDVDFARRRVLRDGEEAPLTPQEFRLLTAFLDHAGQVLSADQLLDIAWNDGAHGSRDQVKLYVGYLRRKLGADVIETVRGFGYRYPAGR